MGDQIVESATYSASQAIITRKAQAIQDAIESGQNVEAIIKREQAIEQVEHDRKLRLIQFDG